MSFSLRNVMLIFILLVIVKKYEQRNEMLMRLEKFGNVTFLETKKDGSLIYKLPPLHEQRMSKPPFRSATVKNSTRSEIHGRKLRLTTSRSHLFRQEISEEPEKTTNEFLFSHTQDTLDPVTVTEESTQTPYGIGRGMNSTELFFPLLTDVAYLPEKHAESYSSTSDMDVVTTTDINVSDKDAVTEVVFSETDSTSTQSSSSVSVSLSEETTLEPKSAQDLLSSSVPDDQLTSKPETETHPTATSDSTTNYQINTSTISPQTEKQLDETTLQQQEEQLTHPDHFTTPTCTGSDCLVTVSTVTNSINNEDVQHTTKESTTGYQIQQNFVLAPQNPDFPDYYDELTQPWNMDYVKKDEQTSASPKQQNKDRSLFSKLFQLFPGTENNERNMIENREKILLKQIFRLVPYLVRMGSPQRSDNIKPVKRKRRKHYKRYEL